MIVESFVAGPADLVRTLEWQPEEQRGHDRRGRSEQAKYSDDDVVAALRVERVEPFRHEVAAGEPAQVSPVVDGHKGREAKGESAQDPAPCHLINEAATGTPTVIRERSQQ